MTGPRTGASVETTQGTVWTFDDETRAGEVVLDDGSRVPFDADVFAASGLRSNT